MTSLQLRGLGVYQDVEKLSDSEDKPKLLIKALKEVLRKLDLVRDAIRKKDYETKFKELSKVEQILQILDSSLDRSYSEISENLSAIYNYILSNLRKVHISLDISKIEESKSLIGTILEGFEKAYEYSRKTNLSVNKKDFRLPEDGLGV